MEQTLLKNENWLYYGMFLDDKSKEKVLSILGEESVPEGWKQYLDHMTVIFNDGSDNARHWASLCEKQVGTTAVLMATHLGVSDRAIALKVIGYQSNNANPHVTISVAPGARPVESNQITTWVPLKNPIYLNTTLNVVNKPRSQWK